MRLETPQWTPSLRKAMRQLWGLGLYRFGLNLWLLCAAFSAFPDHQGFIIAAVLSFNAAVAGIAEYLAFISQAHNRLDDLAERKTRHTIIAAADRHGGAPIADDPTFWSDVTIAVADELADEDDAIPSWWRSAGLVIWNPVGRLLGDLVIVVIALVLSGNG